MFGLTLDAWGKLVLIDAEGVRHVGVTPVRLFPTSDPAHWIAMVDGRGREVAMIDDPASLAPAVRELVERELAHREFMPVIQRIVYVSSIMEPCDWEVVTDCGPTRFVLQNEDDVRRIGPHSGIIVDAQGVRYLIRDTRQLDSYGRRAVEQYI